MSSSIYPAVLAFLDDRPSVEYGFHEIPERICSTYIPSKSFCLENVDIFLNPSVIQQTNVEILDSFKKCYCEVPK